MKTEPCLIISFIPDRHNPNQCSPVHHPHPAVVASISFLSLPETLNYCDFLKLYPNMLSHQIHSHAIFFSQFSDTGPHPPCCHSIIKSKWSRAFSCAYCKAWKSNISSLDKLTTSFSTQCIPNNFFKNDNKSDYIYNLFLSEIESTPTTK